jgi:hypothetical protein
MVLFNSAPPAGARVEHTRNTQARDAQESYPVRPDMLERTPPSRHTPSRDFVMLNPLEDRNYEAKFVPILGRIEAWKCLILAHFDLIFGRVCYASTETLILKDTSSRQVASQLREHSSD